MPIAPERAKFAFDKTERDLLKLSSAQPAETVHNFRTTTRRLQTLLQLLIPAQDRNQKKLLKMLDRIRKRAGRVRDVDVQIAALRSLKIPQEPRRKTQLLQNLLEIRVRHEKKLRKLLSKSVIRELRKRLRRGAKQVNVETTRDPLASAGKLIAQIEIPQHSLKRGSLNHDLLTEEALHQYRILIKRARYAAEFAPRSTESTRFIAQLQRLQDAIGNWHDWMTLTNSATEQIGDISQSSLVALLRNVTGGKYRQAISALSSSPTVQTMPKSVPAPAERAKKRTLASAAVQRVKPAA